MNYDLKPEFYYDREAKQIWVAYEDWCWASRTHIYTEDGEYLDYDDSGSSCAEWCEQLNVETLEEAITLIKEMIAVENASQKQVLCAKVVHEEAYEEDAEWYVVAGEIAPEKHRYVNFNIMEGGYVLETSYLNERDTWGLYTIGIDEEGYWRVVAKPRGVLCAKVETFMDYHFEEEWYVIHEDAMHQPQIDERVDISRYDKGIIIEVLWMLKEHTSNYRQLGFDPKYNSWYIREDEEKIEVEDTTTQYEEDEIFPF